jgi:choline dehydrogenase-like flavoprotein
VIDLRDLPDETVLDADVCIVGAGAAGISMALALSGSHLRVCLIEAGGLGGDQATQALTQGENVGLPYFRLDEVRQMGFGGTTAVWAGACRPLEAIDMQPREWVPHSGWPIQRAELDPYYARAQEICQLGPYAYGVSDWDPECQRRLPLPPEPIQTDVFQIAPTRFGRVHRRAVLEAPNITTVVHANALEVETNDNGQLATGVRLGTLEGKRSRIRARRVVLAMGGLENARLLLLSRQAMACGLGNEHDLVGRFFTEHVYVNSGELILADPLRHSSFYGVAPAGRGPRATRIEAVLSLAEVTAKREGLLRCAVHFPTRWRTHRAFDSDGGRALAHLFREARLGHVPYNWSGRLKRMLREVDQVVALGRAFVTEPRGTRRVLAARSLSEQAPNYDSRVSLSSVKDPLGRQRVQLDWRMTELDFCSVSRFHEILGSVVEAHGVGTFRSALDAHEEWRKRVTGGRHHMGTTRMSATPATGVVDVNCRVFGVENLFVAGSSVFPTVGYANPTLTIVAMSLRLAEHLRTER